MHSLEQDFLADQRAARAQPLGPLGRAGPLGGPKLRGRPAEEVARVLEADLRDSQYFVTGQLTPEVFADDCRFVDPTNDVVGLSRYVKALGVLFDPAHAAVGLEGIEVRGEQEVAARYLLGGYLRFPWRPYVKPFEGEVVWELGEDGLVHTQRQEWRGKSPAEALAESFTPTFGARRTSWEYISAPQYWQDREAECDTCSASERAKALGLEGGSGAPGPGGRE